MARARRTSGGSSSRKRWRTRSRFRSSTSRGSTCSTRPARNGSRATSATGCSTWTGRSATGSRGPNGRGRDRRARTGARSRPSRGGSGQALGAVGATSDWTSCGDVASSRSWGETSSGGCGSRHDNRSTSRAFGTGSGGRRTCTTRFSDRTTRSAKAPGSRTSSTRRTNGPTSGTGRTRPTKDYNQLKTFISLHLLLFVSPAMACLLTTIEAVYTVAVVQGLLAAIVPLGRARQPDGPPEGVPCLDNTCLQMFVANEAGP